ncbi:MAG: PP2C family protein-serine/threonine phosphatase, partial [Chitinivibrionales bacterium]
VGLSSEINFYPDSISIEKGESIFLYTDGVTETQNESGELYGRKRLMDVLRANYNEFDAIIGKVDEKIKEFTASDVQSDDITMFALRRKTS